MEIIFRSICWVAQSQLVTRPDGFCDPAVLSPPPPPHYSWLRRQGRTADITVRPDEQASMTFVPGDIKHANLVDFLLSQLSYRAPCAGGTNTLQRLRVYLAFSFVPADRKQPQREILASWWTLSSQMRWPKLSSCLRSSSAHGFPFSKAFSDKKYLCFPKAVPQTGG